MLVLAFWFGVSALVGVVASAAGRSGIGWFLMGVMVSPLLSALILFVVSERESRERLDARQAPEAIDLGLFGVGNQLAIDELRWGPSCYNDVLAIEGSVAIEASAVPQPATLPLLGLGLLAFVGLRRSASRITAP